MFYDNMKSNAIYMSEAFLVLHCTEKQHKRRGSPYFIQVTLFKLELTQKLKLRK